MGFIDPAFSDIKLGQSTFNVWRVENFEIKPIPTSRYGSFYEGDSYIIYSATSYNHRQYGKGTSEKLEYHIHFWLGKFTTTDESTTAAMKTVELDEMLNGIATQHREIQGHESSRFKSYFKNNIRILKGGIASGLHHVTDSFEARLFKIKGKRRPVMTQQPTISWEWFNSGDVFILETKNKIFIWVGKESNKMEKFQAGKVGIQMKNEGSQRTIIFVDDGKESELKDEDLEEFEEHLSLAERVVGPSEADVVDSQTEETANRKIKLYRCTDEEGTFTTIHVKDGPLKQEDLDPMDTFIIDNNVNGLWIWIGKKASAEERSKGMTKAQDFLTTNNYPSTTSVTRVVDGAEPVEFQMLFINWKDPDTSISFNRPNSRNKTANLHFDAAKLHESPNIAADIQLVDDGNGKTQIWRLHDKELELVPEEHFGIFFSGDCYLIHYTYEVHGRENHILYFWLGAHSSQDERGTIAWHAVKKDDELNGSAVQVRVVQSKEPPQFLMIFKGKMTIFKGGYASSFDGPDGKNEGIASSFMVQVRGGEDHTTQSVQVDMSACSLNSNDVFVLHTRNKTYVWCGKGSTGDERERAKSIAEQWSRTKEYQVIYEGSETENFWQILGGKQDYASEESLGQANNVFPARLFHCSNASGYFKAEEIFDFSQHDLVPNDIMVLDIGSAIFIWVGRGANKVEKTEAPKLVEEYLQTDPRGRDLDTPIITVQQGFEPPNFTGFFGAWDKLLWESSLYRELESEVSDSSKTINNNSEIQKNASDVTKYPIDKLAHKTPEELPDDVDVFHRELHLTEEDFEAAFTMNRIEYNGLPTWKKNNLKKIAGLF